MTPRLRRQAVLVIHGIGEQQPMETLRSFVAAVLPDRDVFSKPDTISRSYELRRLSTILRPRQTTDFFELYWADKVEGTRLRHIFQWLRGLLFRSPATVPPHLRALWVVTWVLLLGLVPLGLLLYQAPLPGYLSREWVRRLVAVLGPLALSIPHGFLIYYLGDAARYLSPSPPNVATRRAIREAGVDLLRQLHRDGYDRIVVVGHSLGSVIAYDILRYHWAEVHASFNDPKRMAQDRLAAMERMLYAEDDAEQIPVARYRAYQRALWTEMYAQGHAWRVTDLITLGSPLAHAPMLLARDQVDLLQKVRDRELPTDPPQPDEQAGLSYVLDPPIRNNRGELVSPRVAHHAALFCCVRWTNLFYPAHGGLFGDLVGGPLTSFFGEGVRDVPLRTGGWWRLTLLAHTRYWRRRRSAVSRGRQDAEEPLMTALDLDWNRDRFTEEREQPTDEGSAS